MNTGTSCLMAVLIVPLSVVWGVFLLLSILIPAEDDGEGLRFIEKGLVFLSVLLLLSWAMIYMSLPSIRA